MYFFVFSTYVFYCFFRWEFLLTIIRPFLAPNKMIAVIRIKNNEYFVFSRKKSISIGFVHKSQNLAILGPTLTYKRSRDLRTVYPVVANMVSKVAQDFNENTHEVARQYLRALRNYRGKSRGGVPPSQIRVKHRVLEIIH